ncbi:hypothetical protein BRADI_1g52716v3 [Brachypodium distachyon]|uniref:Uncharacterized protein n=1 Tax=Brachypodium distachyon TaxID=15368 RepID=A0A2K2DR53_BRADI|nr:hypothetical protein BRADI_1g52716v3 [Brachypodium distachyon]
MSFGARAQSALSTPYEHGGAAEYFKTKNCSSQAFLANTLRRRGKPGRIRPREASTGSGRVVGGREGGGGEPWRRGEGASHGGGGKEVRQHPREGGRDRGGGGEASPERASHGGGAREVRQCEVRSAHEREDMIAASSAARGRGEEEEAGWEWGKQCLGRGDGEEESSS